MLLIYFFVLLLIGLDQKSVNGASAKIPVDDVIMYPGPKKEVHRDHEEYPADLPLECRGKNYCTIKPPDYPQEKFNHMFKNYKKPQLGLLPAPVLEPTFVNRQGDPDEKDNCESIVTYEPLYRVKSTKGTWRVVVQAPDHDYIQRVRLESCMNEGESCFTVFTEIPDVVTACKQKYITWEVLVAAENNKTEKVKTDLPVCCSCHYKRVQFSNRFGTPVATTSKKV